MTGATPDELWPLVRNYHCSARMAGLVRHTFAWRRSGGLWGDFGDPVAGVTYSQPVNRNLPQDALELSRLVRRDNFSERLSAFVTWSLRWLRGNTAVPFIYQACGFVYVGEFASGNIGFEAPGGSFIHGRICNSRFGTRSIEAIMKIKPDWVPVYGEPKHLYVFPLRQRLKSILRQRGWQSFPYPKPNNAACLSDAPPPSGVSHEHIVEAAP